MANESINTPDREAAEAKNYPPLEMDVNVRLIEPTKNLLGFANVTFNNAVTVTDFKVLRAEDGNLFVGMPSKPDPSSRTGYSATVRVGDTDTKQQLTGAVVTAYHGAVEKLKARAAALTTDKPPIAEQMAKAGKEAAEHNAAKTPQDKGGQKRDERT